MNLAKYENGANGSGTTMRIITPQMARAVSLRAKQEKELEAAQNDHAVTLLKTAWEHKSQLLNKDLELHKKNSEISFLRRDKTRDLETQKQISTANERALRIQLEAEKDKAIQQKEFEIKWLQEQLRLRDQQEQINIQSALNRKDAEWNQRQAKANEELEARLKEMLGMNAPHGDDTTNDELM